MGIKTNEEYLVGLRGFSLEQLQKLHDGWVKELGIPSDRRSSRNKNGGRMDDEGCEAFIKLFKILIKEKHESKNSERPSGDKGLPSKP